MAAEIEVLQVLKVLGDIYPSYQLSSTAIEMYVRLLDDIPGNILGQSVLDHISRSSFFPSIAELRMGAFNIIDAVDPVQSGYEAWEEVQGEMQRVGYLNRPKFTNPITDKVVDSLGWTSLCNSDNPVADRAHFIQAYQAMLESHRIASRRLQEVNEFIKSLNSAKTEELPFGKNVGG